MDAIKYKFVVAIQAIIDICHHIVARLSERLPDKYGEYFLILKDMGYIDSEYALKLRTMAGFRNVLVHLDHGVDDRNVCKFLKEDLLVNDKFLEIVNKITEFALIPYKEALGNPCRWITKLSKMRAVPLTFLDSIFKASPSPSVSPG